MALQLQMTWQRGLLGQKRKTGGPLGLKNLGNSCYINSVLQCLTYTPPLANFCLKYQHSSLCDSGSEAADRKRECPFCILEKRIVRSLSADITLDAPLKIQSCLRIFAEHFRCGHQEDAHEFLRYVIDACHNACLRLKKLRGVRKGGDGDVGFSGGGGSVVKEIFGGSMQSQVKCLSCGVESNKVDEIMDVSLDILHSNSLKEALQKFFQPEVLDGSNKYKCEKCKKLVAARKQMSILQAPNVLVIQLKRFEGILGGKIDKAIAFDEVLVLSNLMCKASQDLLPEYNLFGTIVHSGYSPESGHYYAYIKDAMGRWYCCNDSYVSLSTLQEVLSEKVYILFFSRTNQRPVHVSTTPASNGVKSRDCNGSEAFKIPKAAVLFNTTHTKPNVEEFSQKDISTTSKIGKVPSSPWMKFIPRNSNSKRVPVNGNGSVDARKSQSMVRNGNLKDSPCMATNQKDVSSQITSNGSHKDKMVDENDKVLALPVRNGHALNVGINSVKPDLSEDNGTKSKGTTGRGCDHHELHNGEEGITGSKRKAQENFCIFFGQDDQSRGRVEELKEVLKKDASAVLRSCGWSDKVYNFMRSKRLCTREAGNTPSSSDDLKNMLIADAKQAFISQIPESLKEDFIKRLCSFSNLKWYRSGP